MNPTATEKLDQVAALQFAFKSVAVERFAVALVDSALRSGVVWPDEVSTAELGPEDRNCIGTVYRWLWKVEILARTGRFRASQAEDRKGSTVFEYKVVSRSLAETFLKRHQAGLPQQFRQSEFGL